MSVIKNSLETLLNRLFMCAKRHIYYVKFSKLTAIYLCENKLYHLTVLTILWATPSLRDLNLNNNNLFKTNTNFLPLLPKLRVFALYLAVALVG